MKNNTQEQRPEAHEEQIDFIAHKVTEHDKQLDFISRKVTEHDGKLDNIVLAVVDHSDRLDRIEENMATKDDLRGISNTLDKIVGLVEKRDQEVTFMGERLRRVEDDVREIKPLVGLV